MLKKTLIFVISGMILVAIFGNNDEQKLSASTTDKKEAKIISKPKSSFEIEKEKYSNPSNKELESAASYLTKMSKAQSKENIINVCKVNNDIDISCRDRILSKHGLNYEKWNHYFGHIYFHNMNKFNKTKASNGSEIYSLK